MENGERRWLTEHQGIISSLPGSQDGGIIGQQWKGPSDEEDDESSEEEGGPRQATPWAPHWSTGAPRFPGMPQWPPTISEEQTVCTLTATFVQPAQLVRTSQSKISVQCHSTNYARAGCETPCPG